MPSHACQGLWGAEAGPSRPSQRGAAWETEEGLSHSQEGTRLPPACSLSHPRAEPAGGERGPGRPPAAAHSSWIKGKENFHGTFLFIIKGLHWY